MVPAQGVLEDHRRDRRLFLVDVRGKDFFEAARIPGSAYVPVYALRTSALLRGRHVVLVDHGYGSGRLIEECRRLRQPGGAASAAILEGGINYWRRIGGPVQGGYSAQEALAFAPPAAFHQARRFPGWLVVDISSTPTPGVEFLLPGRVSVDPARATAEFARLLESRQAGRGATCAFVFNEDGDYTNHTAAFASFREANVFFLEGGLRAYADHLRKQTAMRQRATVKETRTEPCEGCP